MKKTSLKDFVRSYCTPIFNLLEINCSQEEFVSVLVDHLEESGYPLKEFGDEYIDFVNEAYQKFLEYGYEIAVYDRTTSFFTALISEVNSRSDSKTEIRCQIEQHFIKHNIVQGISRIILTKVCKECGKESVSDMTFCPTCLIRSLTRKSTFSKVLLSRVYLNKIDNKSISIRYCASGKGKYIVNFSGSHFNSCSFESIFKISCNKDTTFEQYREKLIEKVSTQIKKKILSIEVSKKIKNIGKL